MNLFLVDSVGQNKGLRTAPIVSTTPAVPHGIRIDAVLAVPPESMRFASTRIIIHRPRSVNSRFPQHRRMRKKWTLAPAADMWQAGRSM